jgi:tRNA dimethylallyltransferase
MIDVVDPDEPFDAARYAAMAREVLRRLHRQRVVPVVAGGTGLYIKALLHGLCDAPRADTALRRQLADEARRLGPQALHRRLAKWDAAAAERIHPNDARRIARALEVMAATGRALSARQAEHGFDDEPFEVFAIGLTMDRAALYERINRRVEHMVAQGLLDEVRLLLDRGYAPGLNSMRAIGYRHMVDYINARTNWQETVRLLKRDTRRFAKRQFTWFKADPSIRWTEFHAFADMVPQIKSFLSQGL